MSNGMASCSMQPRWDRKKKITRRAGSAAHSDRFEDEKKKKLKDGLAVFDNGED